VWAARGEGCWWNGRRAAVSGVQRLDESCICYTEGRSFDEQGKARAWEALIRSTRVQRGWGDCYGHVLVATGRAEASFDAIMSPWDCGPLLPILEESGGTFTDWQGQATWIGLNFQKPTKFYRRANWNLNEWNDWTAGGLPLEHAVNSNLHVELKNSWWVHGGGTWGGLGTVYCDRCARGGPALRTSETLTLWGGVNGDDRRIVSPSLWFNYQAADEGRTRFTAVSPSVTLRLSSRWSSSLRLDFRRNRDDRQWYGNFTGPDGTTHYAKTLQEHNANVEKYLR
jgi:hypothetical protein